MGLATWFSSLWGAAVVPPPSTPVVAPIAAPAAAPMITTVTVPASMVAETLSPSQVKTFLQCTARWYFKYIERLPEVCTGNLVVGRAVHAAVAAYFRGKRAGGAPDLGYVAHVYESAIAEELDQAELRDDEDASELRDTGRRCVEAYLETAASVQPRLIEEWVSGEISGVRVRGILDLMDAAGPSAISRRLARSPPQSQRTIACN